MNIGEMQRSLSLKAGKMPNHQFGDLHSLVCREDWLRLAYEYVRQNAGSKTAGCDGIDMGIFEENLDGNLVNLREALRSDTKLPVDANKEENLCLRCIDCHKRKTELEPQAESRMQ